MSAIDRAAILVTRAYLTTTLPTTFTFWFMRINHFRMFVITICMQIHMCSPYQLPSTSPACDCQEITSLSICDSPLGSCYIVGPASLFMALGSPGNTGGSIQRSSSNKRLRVARQNLRFGVKNSFNIGYYLEYLFVPMIVTLHCGVV